MLCQLFCICTKQKLRNLILPVFHEQVGGVLALPPRSHVRRIRKLPHRDVCHVACGTLLLEAVQPLEPSEVAAKPSGGNPSERGHEALDSGMHVVDSVQLPMLLGIVCVMASDSKLPHHWRIRVQLVRGHDCSLGDLVLKHRERSTRVKPSATGHVVEHIASVVDSSEHANLLLGYSALMVLVAAMPSGTGELEGAACVIALEALPEERLVKLSAASLANLERWDMPPKRLHGAMAHEPCRLQTDMATSRTLAQREPVNEALDELHPLASSSFDWLNTFCFDMVKDFLRSRQR